MNLTNASYCSESFCCRMWSYSSLTLSVRSLHMRSQMMVICLRVKTGFSFVPTNARALKPLPLGLLPEPGEPVEQTRCKVNSRTGSTRWLASLQAFLPTYHTSIRLNHIFLPLFHPSTLSFILLHFACKKMTSELINGEERGPKSGMGQSVLLY